MKMFRIIQTQFAALLALLLLSACSVPVPETGKRFFFPPPPGEPRLEYLKGYFTDHDLKPSQQDFLSHYVLGETRPYTIFTAPVDVASTGKGKVYVTDSGLRQVLVLDLVKHEVRELSSIAMADGNERAFGAPYGITLDADGRLYVCDIIAKRVEVFDAQERHLFTLYDPDFGRPTSVAVDLARETIYVVDTAKHRLVLFDMQGKFLGYRGERGTEPGQFNFPTDVDIDREGNMFVLDALNARVQVFDATGQFLWMFGERGTAEGSFEIPKNLAVAETGQVYVTDALAHKVVIFSHEGELLLRIGGRSVVRKGVSPGGFYMPRGIDIDEEGGLWVVDSLNRGLHHFQFLNPKYLSEHPIDPAQIYTQ